MVVNISKMKQEIFTDEFLKEIGFTLIEKKKSEFKPYPIYGKAKDRTGMTMLKKESKRHKNFKFLKKYDRLMHRDNTIQESEVPFTEELKTEALNQFMSKIKVLKWSEKK